MGEPEPVDRQTRQDRSIDALAAMADGQDLWPDAKDKPPAAPGAQAIELPAAAPPSPEEIEARKARTEALRTRTRQAHAHHFRNLMIPMLLVTAVLLLLLATIAAFMLPTPEEAEMNSSNLLGRPWAKYLIYAAFPLALILLVAAGIFWQDLRRSRDSANAANR